MLLIDAKISSVPEFDPDEIGSLLSNNAVFKPYKSGISFSNLRITTDYDDPATIHNFVLPIRIEGKAVKFTDIDFRAQGTIFYAVTTVFSWHMENVIYETQNMYRLCYIEQVCTDSGSYMGAIMYFKNVTSVNSGTKPAYLHNEISHLRAWWAGDIYFEDVNFDSYLGYPIGIFQNIIFLRHTN